MSSFYSQEVLPIKVRLQRKLHRCSTIGSCGFQETCFLFGLGLGFRMDQVADTDVCDASAFQPRMSDPVKTGNWLQHPRLPYLLLSPLGPHPLLLLFLSLPFQLTIKWGETAWDA